MAGLKELIDSGKFEDDKTSSVPGDNDNSFEKEKYDPSALKGFAGMAAVGIGAVAARNPIARALNKLVGLRKPKLSVSRTTAPVDEVEEVLTIAPTKIERGQLMKRPQITQQEQIRQEAIARSNELKKIAYLQPLSRGGKTNRIGSSLYDYIARHPVSGSRKADEWIKDLKSTGPGSFKTGNPDFKNISQAVKKEEMWDSNLLQLNKQGEVVGGFLKTAAEKGLPLSKMDLLYIVEKAPVNNLKMRKLQTNVKLVDEAEDVTRQMNLGLQDLRDKVVAKGGDEAGDIVTDIAATQNSLLKINSRLTKQFRKC
jgi:hypothetical protein